MIFVIYLRGLFIGGPHFKTLTLPYFMGYLTFNTGCVFVLAVGLKLEHIQNQAEGLRKQVTEPQPQGL